MMFSLEFFLLIVVGVVLLVGWALGFVTAFLLYQRWFGRIMGTFFPGADVKEHIEWLKSFKKDFK